MAKSVGLHFRESLPQSCLCKYDKKESPSKSSIGVAASSSQRMNKDCKLTVKNNCLQVGKHQIKISQRD